MKNKMSAIVAAAYMASLLCFGAYAEGAGGVVEDVGEGAGNVIENVADGAGDVVEGVGEAAGDVLDGAGSAVEEITGADDPAETAPDAGLVTTTGDTDDDDVADDVDAAQDDKGKTDDDVRKIYEAEANSTDKNDRNPATGVPPVMPAVLITAAAAGTAYLTKKKHSYDDPYLL